MSGTGLKKGELVRPIVEFLPIYSEESQRGASFVLFHPFNDDEEPDVYLEGVKLALKQAHGIYIFYDSRGKALYAGRAVEQSLWVEANKAYNRPREESQFLWRVDHPRIRPREFNRDQRRRVKLEAVALHELAVYMSAFEVAKDFIKDAEALLVRAFANDLLNTRMETFSGERAPGEQE